MCFTVRLVSVAPLLDKLTSYHGERGYPIADNMDVDIWKVEIDTFVIQHSSLNSSICVNSEEISRYKRQFL